MTVFDVFNGDADGLCALHQMRLAEPRETTLVTGVKRDVALLKSVSAGDGDQVYVFDISLDKNLAPLKAMLDKGVKVTYFDHHYPGDIPSSSLLEIHIELLPDKGTSLLVDEYLNERFRAWAVVGTFGDNFDIAARRAAQPLGLREDQIGILRNLGIYLNYNGYGARVEDLHIPPVQLFRSMQSYEDPLEFVANDPAFGLLENGYREDMVRVTSIEPALKTDTHGVYCLPAAPWARRVGGVFANQLAQSAPDRAHALLTQLPDDGFLVSVRAPLSHPEGADQLCRQFPTGGGRKAAAGINRLEPDLYDDFLKRFTAAF
ncbi:MAG: acetyltransferase [Gammaproteobacteria bacterium]|nr:acetyltransferase [Gammaproteobacteria bacterium]